MTSLTEPALISLIVQVFVAFLPVIVLLPSPPLIVPTPPLIVTNLPLLPKVKLSLPLPPVRFSILLKLKVKLLGKILSRLPELSPVICQVASLSETRLRVEPPAIFTELLKFAVLLIVTIPLPSLLPIVIEETCKLPISVSVKSRILGLPLSVPPIVIF